MRVRSLPVRIPFNRVLAARIALLLCLGLQVAACTQLGFVFVDDTKLLHVDVLQPAQIPDRDKFWKYKAPLIRVEFSSMTDIQNVANTGNYGVGTRVSICNGQSIDRTRILDGYPHVFDKFGSVYTYDKRKTSRTQDNQSGPIIYHIYIAPRQSGIKGWYSYDLVHTPSDVCFFIGGVGEIIPTHFSSNIVVIPKQMLIDAFERAGLK